MKIEIHNKAVAGLVIICLALLVAAATTRTNELTTDSGDLLLNATGDWAHILVNTNVSGNLEVDGVTYFRDYVSVKPTSGGTDATIYLEALPADQAILQLDANSSNSGQQCNLKVDTDLDPGIEVDCQDVTFDPDWATASFYPKTIEELGNTNSPWNRVWLHNITSSDKVISIIPEDSEGDDYLQIKNIDDSIVQLHRVGGGILEYTSDLQVGGEEIELGANSAAAYINMESGDNKILSFYKYNATSNGGKAYIRNNDGRIDIQADDTNDYITFHTDGNEQYIYKTNSGGTANHLYFRAGSSGTWQTLHAGEFTDEVADLAEYTLIKNNKEPLDYQLRIHLNGSLDTRKANPGVYDGNMVRVGEGVVDNALKINQLHTQIQILNQEIEELKKVCGG